MVVVDCNVLVHLLLDGEQTPRARALLGHDADWHSDGFIMIELSNVLATHLRARGLAMRDAVIVMNEASGVMDPGLHAAGNMESLELAALYRISAYDARYLVVARDLGVKLVTEDTALRKAAPKLTESLAQAVGY